jgi:hypothetical protein
VSTEKLLSNDRGHTLRDTQTDERGSGVTAYISNFIKFGSGIQKLKNGIHRYSDRMEIS